MSVPTIASVTPAVGPTGGWTLVQVEGTDFRLPDPPPPTGIAPVAGPTVAVLFGTTPARLVRVFRSTLLVALTDTHDAGAVNVVVKNLDNAGVPIPGEQATLLNGFTYTRPKLTDEDHLTRLCRYFIRELKRQVMENVVPAVHTDYANLPGSGVAMPATLPALIVAGPELAEDRFRSLNEEPQLERASTVFDRHRVPLTVDLSFTIVGVSDSTDELLNLLAATRQCFHRTKRLGMLRDEADPSKGTVLYEMDVPLGGDFKVATQANESNIRNFTGTVVVYGYDMEGLAGFYDDTIRDRGGRVAADGVRLQTERPG